MGAITEKKNMKNATKTFISSAFWTERIGPACAVAFIKKHKKFNLGKHTYNEKVKKLKCLEKKCKRCRS